MDVRELMSRRFLGKSGGVPLAAGGASLRATAEGRAAVQLRRRHAPSARQWFDLLAPRLYVVTTSGERVRSGFRNVIEDGEHR